MREVVIVAGEASGDLHAAGVARELRALRPDLALVGIGGHHMEEAGVTLLERAERLAVMGFVEVLRHVPAHWRLLRQLEARLRGGDVALLVLLDYPGFNMKLADAAHRAGVPVLYYITPQVWAWGAKRIPRLARTVTKAAVIFSFEETLLREAGVDAEFVGHPLLDHVHELPDAVEARQRLGLDPARPVLALFPGSRRQEIARHLEVFVAVARELQRRRPLLQVVVSVAPTVDVDPARCPFPAVRGESMTVLRAASAALCKSGTTTLQAAVADCPLVVAYRTNPWTYRIARRVVRIPHIGLVNIVAGREVAREFVQEALLPEQVADALTPLLDEGSAAREALRRELAHVRARLGEPGAAARVARLASALASRSAAPSGAARA
ncbi:MAG TPA: lipid-A-disaccharide synthase [Gemmatimonadaceae bacterium]|nr:lipid-A-disaccharide synthase [Gemmatimonadaceae bacterium]